MTLLELFQIFASAAVGGYFGGYLFMRMYRRHLKIMGIAAEIAPDLEKVTKAIRESKPGP